MGFFSDFHERCVVQKSLNATFLCLLLKIARADNIKNFSPTGIVGSVYKLLAKVIASRLRKVNCKL